MSSKRKNPEDLRRRASGTTRRPPVALIVDDSPDSREMYGDVLRRGGYRTLEASDGAAALAVAFEQRPDVIVMDLCMPRMDGWEAIRRLKTDPRTRATPVVALTAIGWNSRAIEVNCEAYLVKPCLPIDLLAVLDDLVVQSAQA